VFENRVLRGGFRTKRDEETGGWRKLHNEVLRNIIRMIKSRRMRLAVHVAQRLTTAQQRSTGQNLPFDLYTQKE
jgi:predicted Fe-S protein YdhL (DUF1289 family)